MTKPLTTPGDPPRAPADEPVHWLVRPETIRRIWIVFSAILVGIVLADLGVHHYEYFGIDDSFGFYAWYGFGTCLLMVVGAKALGFVLKRPDDYYEDGGPPGDGPAGGEA
ncbi:MAG: hypothetical protein RH859_09810 [Longimicrobiales bacterium]